MPPPLVAAVHPLACKEPLHATPKKAVTLGDGFFVCHFYLKPQLLDGIKLALLLVASNCRS